MNAAIVSCPGTAATTDREFTLDTTPDATCLAFDAGNLSGNGDSVNDLGYITLDKSDDGTSGAVEGSLTFTPPTSGTSGTFSLDTAQLSGYTDFVLALKTGEGQLNPDWAAFSLPAGATSGDWAVSGQQALSHAVLYGKVAPVPLPAAVWLFGASLLGFAGLAKRKQKA